MNFQGAFNTGFSVIIADCLSSVIVLAIQVFGLHNPRGVRSFTVSVWRVICDKMKGDVSVRVRFSSLTKASARVNRTFRFDLLQL